MLIEEIKNIKGEKSELRRFGLTVGIILGLFGGLFFWHGKNYYQYFLILSFLLIFLGISIPQLLKPIQKVWMTIAVTIGWFMTRVILGILFYLGLTTIRILALLFGKRFLDIKFIKDNNINSYWLPKEGKPYNKNDYEKRF